jgi:seryl-tRNA synthetase
MSLAHAHAHTHAPETGPDLLAEGLWRDLGADGLYARSEAYEAVVAALAAFLTRHRPPFCEVLRFPPVMSRRQLERSGYLMSFPNLLGCVSCLAGGEREIKGAVARFEAGGTWTDGLAAADLVLTPAACYPVYPLVAQRGALPAAGLVFDVGADCFRREPSREIDRLQSFRMREFVRIGSAEQVTQFRQEWIERGRALADQLALPHDVVPASDPFFGRGGQIMAASQVEQALKFELVIPVRPGASPTACMSFNYHQDHFGEAWEIRGRGGALAHTGCAAFGMDRLAVALFATHGPDAADWPAGVRAALGL